jgi:hypothetical protein
MMSECNYLLDTNKLAYEDLLTYLRRRERAYISFLEFCIDKAVFNKSILLDILQHQELNKTLFSESLRAIAGNEFTNDLIKVYYSQIPSIFRFIDYSDKIEVKINLVRSDEEVGIVSQTQPDISSDFVAIDQIQEDASIFEHVDFQQSDEDDHWVFPDIQSEEPDSALVEDFLQTFDEEKKTDMENTIISLKVKTDGDLVSAMSYLYRDFHTIKGSSRFAKLKVFETITHELEDLISVSQSIYSNLQADSRELIEEALLLGMDVLWSLKITISEYLTEMPMANDQDWLGRVDRMIKCLKRARASTFEALHGQTEEDLLSKF